MYVHALQNKKMGETPILENAVEQRR